MFKQLFETVFIKSTKLTTYKTGLLQAKAYRILKQKTSLLLESHGLSSLEWALLGLLFDHPSGFKLVEIAELLGVEAPFVTVMIDTLEQKKLVKRTVSKEDKRAKTISLTAKALKQVPKIEDHLRKGTRELLKSLKSTEVLIYFKVLTQIVNNFEAQESKK